MFYVLLLIASLTLSADYLIIDNSHAYCATEYYYDSGALVYRNAADSALYSAVGNTPVLTGYDFNGSVCRLLPILESSGLNFEDWSYLMGFAGLLVGFTILFHIVGLLPYIVRKD